MNNNPYMYEAVNLYNASINPSTTHIANIGLEKFYEDILMKRVMNTFKFTLPDSWNKTYFLYSLFYWGFLTVFKTDEFGVVPQACGLSGYDFYYQPAYCQVANPHLKGIQQLRIGKDCELIQIQPDYKGLQQLVSMYAELMALAISRISTNLVNTTFGFAFGVENDKSAQSIKKLYDEITSGNVAVFADKNLFDEMGNSKINYFNQNIGQNFISDKIFDLYKSFMNEFDSLVGIPNANTEKKERLITDEVNSNNVETQVLSDLWLETLEESISRVKDMFPELELSVEKRYKDGSENDNEPTFTL